jgi:protein involved in polysaccharide export with SLBB domain
MEFPMNASGLGASISNGDIIRIYSNLASYKNTVTLRGNVADPGRFSWKPGMHLSDIIPDRDSLLSRDYWWQRSHQGLPAPEFEPFIGNLEFHRTPSTSLPRSRSGTVDEYSHSNNAYADSNGTLQESRTFSQDPTKLEGQNALTAGLAATDIDPTSAYSADIARNREAGGGGTVGSQLNQTSRSGQQEQRKRIDVRLTTPEIDWNYAVIERLDHNTLRTSLIPFDLGKLIMQHDPSQDLPLQPGDIVTIFSQSDIKVPLEEQTKYIHLEGEFVHAGIYSVKAGETLRDVIARAGGLTTKAYLYGSEFDRESTRILQQQRIDEYIRRVDLDASRGALALSASQTSAAGNAASASAAAAAATSEQQLVAHLRQIRATGRIVLNFNSRASSLDDLPAIPLENGDRFLVPPVPATINVVGAVYNQNSFLYQDGTQVERYLKLAGGPDRDADHRRAFVIRADGSVISHNAANGPWGNKFAELRLNPGDTIVVPDKTLRPTALRGLLDWTQIFSQLALGAAAVQVLRQ